MDKTENDWSLTNFNSGIPQDGKKRVKASHDYGGDGKTKLTLCVGDIVQLLIPQPRDGWHYGQNERTTDRGWFPIQYTTKVKPETWYICLGNRPIYFHLQLLSVFTSSRYNFIG